MSEKTVASVKTVISKNSTVKIFGKIKNDEIFSASVEMNMPPLIT